MVVVNSGGVDTRDTSMAAITYYHVELPHHDLLLAEGAAAESWLDTGNRGMFANAPGSVDLYADLEPDLTSEAWQTQACAPLVEGGLDLAVIRARLEGRAITSVMAGVPLRPCGSKPKVSTRSRCRRVVAFSAWLRSPPGRLATSGDWGRRSPR